MDYGIIFIIIIVIIIIIAIILIIIANRNNVTNILTELPSYRIQNFDNPTTADNNYLGLKNITTIPSTNTTIPVTNISFWSSFVCSGLSNNDLMGIWKIENTSDPKAIITSGSTVYLVNYVYNLQTFPNLGYVSIGGNLPGGLPLSTGYDTTSATKFIYTVTGTNTFTLQTIISGVTLPVIVDKTNNFILISTNRNIKPSIFRLVFQQQ